ncbi:hypothetical protein [Streptomyces violaceusniger]|uniref:hypothetical protein n=1 Tax=Streptomyces violaceusniger TaxID=68280 RepID=UPI003805B0F5
MSIVSELVAFSQTGEAKPPLPQRPIPHERDGRQPVPVPGRPHPQVRVGGAVRASLLPPPPFAGRHTEKGCACGRGDKCRCPNPTPPGTAAFANDACVLCGWWRCRCGEARAFVVEVEAAIAAIAAGVLPAEAADIGSGFCQGCGQGVSTLNGRYTCGACGHNG